MNQDDPSRADEIRAQSARRAAGDEGKSRAQEIRDQADLRSASEQGKSRVDEIREQADRRANPSREDQAPPPPAPMPPDLQGEMEWVIPDSEVINILPPGAQQQVQQQIDAAGGANTPQVQQGPDGEEQNLDVGVPVWVVTCVDVVATGGSTVAGGSSGSGIDCTEGECTGPFASQLELIGVCSGGTGGSIGMSGAPCGGSFSITVPLGTAYCLRVTYTKLFVKEISQVGGSNETVRHVVGAFRGADESVGGS